MTTLINSGKIKFVEEKAKYELEATGNISWEVMSHCMFCVSSLQSVN